MLGLRRLLPSGSVDLLFSHFCCSFLTMEQSGQHLPFFREGYQGGGSWVDGGLSHHALVAGFAPLCLGQQGKSFVEVKFL